MNEEWIKLKIKEHENRIVELEKTLKKHLNQFDAHKEPTYIVKTHKEIQDELLPKEGEKN